MYSKEKVDDFKPYIKDHFIKRKKNGGEKSNLNIIFFFISHSFELKSDTDKND